MSKAMNQNFKLNPAYRLLDFPNCRPLLFLVLAAVVWVFVYVNLSGVAAAVIAMLPLDQTGHLADSLRFLIFAPCSVRELISSMSSMLPRSATRRPSRVSQGRSL